MKRRTFIKKSGLGLASFPYILPTGRLFASTGSRVANHVVFVLFAGGIRNQEAVGQEYLAHQAGQTAEGNLMENMLSGAPPSLQNRIYDRWAPTVSSALSEQGTLFKEVLYREGPTGHYNGHTVAMTGNYTETGLNLNINPEFPTIFEYYRKHSDPAMSAINTWWLSEGLGPYPSLNYSQHNQYGANYGANYLRPLSLFNEAGSQLSDAVNYQPDDVDRILKVKNLLDDKFHQPTDSLSGVKNTAADREAIKSFLLNTREQAFSGMLDVATPGNNYDLLSGDLINISIAWQVLNSFAPELMVINTTNVDVCHDNFSGYISLLHQADYGVGWLWEKIQSHPVLANDTIMICMPEHGRNLDGNNVLDGNGFRAYDHTGDDNSRRTFAMIVGPPDKVVQGQILGAEGIAAAESVDIVPTIAHILGFRDYIPAYLMQGRALTEAFV